MLRRHELVEEHREFFETIGLLYNGFQPGVDKQKKIEQIIAYLEVIDSQVRKYSRREELVFVDSCAGNCLLSFLVNYYYLKIDPRPIRIHCVDFNEKLMEKNSLRAAENGWDRIHFHASDIFDYKHSGRLDAVYTLHACDTATDKAMYLGARNRARNIMSVSCCQHTIKKQIRSNPATSSVTRHAVFKDRMAYMVADTLRSLLLQMNGYEVDIIEFVSARATDKNILVRAKKGQPRSTDSLRAEYLQLQEAFRIYPALEDYLGQAEGMINNYLSELNCAC